MIDRIEAVLRHGSVPRHCGVLGHPISHSLSPQLHMAAYRSLGLQGWTYERRDVQESQLRDFMSQLDASWAGLSLTMPLKRTIMSYGTPANTWAAQLGVANTAVFEWPDNDIRDALNSNPSVGPPSIMLYNTDVDGIIGAISRHAAPGSSNTASTQSSQALIIGNGNTALSAVAACSTFSGITDLVIAARRPQAGEHIRAFLAHQAPSLTARYVDLDSVAGMLPQSSLVISTLPAHVADPMASAIRDSHMATDGVLLDVAYDPRPSMLNEAWQQAGGISITGDEMLLYQAIPQVELMTRQWCGHFDRTLVEQSMRETLRGVLR